MTFRGPLGHFSPPCAPAELRKRVLAAARTALASSRPPSRSDRIWFSAGWRLAWVAAIASFALVEAFSVRSNDFARAHARPQATLTRETEAAAAALGISGRGLIGADVVLNDEKAGEGMEAQL